jgi:hypothetical protein
LISHEWLEESESSSDVIHLDSPSTSICCQIYEYPFDALYNLVMGLNIMSVFFAHDLLEYMPLTPTMKFLKSPLGHILPSLGILYVLPILVNKTLVNLSFYIFDVIEFDLLIGQPIERLIHEGQIGKLNICLGKNLSLLIFISHSLNTESESCLELDPMDEVKAASFESFIEPNLENDAQFFIKEEDDQPPQPLYPFEESPKPPIELKPLPSGLHYVFLNNDPNTFVIISDKLSQEEKFRLITILEKHRSAFGYSL